MVRHRSLDKVTGTVQLMLIAQITPPLIGVEGSEVSVQIAIRALCRR